MTEQHHYLTTKWLLWICHDITWQIILSTTTKPCKNLLNFRHHDHRNIMVVWRG
jgi:hypothetical protein